VTVRVTKVDRISIAVRSLEAARAFFERHFDAEFGPVEAVTIAGDRRQPFTIGGFTLELLAPHAATSPVARFLERRGEGVYQIAFRVEDLDGAADDPRAGSLTVIGPRTPPEDLALAECRWLEALGHLADALGVLLFVRKRSPVAQEAEPGPRESEARFHRLADAAPLPMWCAQADGRRTFFNAAWLAFRGRTSGEEAGEGWLEGLHPEDRPQVVGALREAIAAGRPYRIEYRLRRADGQYRWLVESACPHHGPGEAVAGYVGSATDVTDHRVAEGERARLREELRHAEALRTLGQLAGAIAHDFNNALAAIVGNVELVRAALPPGSAEADYADEALKAGWRAQEMVHQLLALSRRKAPSPGRDPGREGAAPEPPGARVTAEARRERILLIDDDAGLVDLWWRLLGVFGYDVVGRTDPQEGLALLRLMPDAFDVVVTDDSMAGLTGLALAREVVRIRPDLPVILLTGSDPDAPPEVLAQSGVRTVVLKPATVQDLSAAIREVRRHRPPEEPPRRAP
jgi:PAS domain S-box-containing protein